MADTIAKAIYELGLQNQQYLAAAQSQLSVNNQLVASQEKVAVSEEKAGGASLLAANAMQRRIEANIAGAREERKFAEAMAFSARAAQEGRATAEQRAIFLEQETAKLNTARAAIEAKAKAQRDAAQAERDAEAAAKNLARVESEHALALKNTASALGVDRNALIAAANAGNRHAAATLDMMNKIVGLNKELQAGRISLAGHAAEIDRVQAAYRNQTTAIATQEVAMRKSNTITGLARHELINLSRQLQDIGVSLAGGQSPFRILIEQGSQIADIFASSKAAFGDTFRNLISWVGRAAGSITGIITIVTTLGAAAGALALNWLEGQRVIEKALTGIGERAGVSVAQVQKMAEAASSNTRLSTNAAREAAAEFIKTGKIYSENIGVAVNLTDKFALAMGVSASEGAKQLAEILSDVNKGAITLDKSFGFLDGRTREMLSTLVSQNRQQEAIALLMEKAAPAITKAADAASVYAKSWIAVTKAISDSIEMMGRALVKGAEFEAARPDPGRQRQGSPGRVMAQGLRGELPVSADAANKATKAVEAYEQALIAAADAAASSRFREFGIAADDAVKSMFPQIEQLKVLRKSYEDLKRAQGDSRITSDAGLANQYKAASDALQLQIRMQEESIEKTQRQTAEVLKVAAAYKNVSVETALALKEFDNQLIIARAVTGQEKLIAQEKVRTNQLILAGTKATEAAAIAAKERLVAETQIASQHKLNMAALEDQLRIVSALPGHAQQMAQYQADINARLREGATLMQAEEEAAIRLKIAREQANRAVDSQIISLRQAVEMERARMEGTEGAVAAAHAYANAIRSGASETKAAALAAATLEANLERAQIAAERMANSMQSGQMSAAQMSAAIKATQAQAVTMGSFGGIPIIPGPSGIRVTQYMIDYARQDLAQRAGKSGEATPGGWSREAADQRNAQAAQAAAQAAQDAARAQEDAAQAQQAAAEAMYQAAQELVRMRDELAPEAVAGQLLAGLSPQAINAMIEQNQILFGTSSARFQAQLDLYKRAGMSQSQITADIRAGLIGEGAKPSELLAAIEELTGAVNSNTAAQIGLSDFYTQQGDRLLGYRGFNVQTGIRSRVGVSGPGGVIDTGGMGTGGMGSVVNPPLPVPQPPPPQPPNIVYNYFYPPQPEAMPIIVQAPAAPAPPSSTYYTGLPTQPKSIGSLGSYYTGSFAEGGIVNQPTLGLFGEAGPEAVVPLKNGAVPVTSPDLAAIAMSIVQLPRAIDDLSKAMPPPGYYDQGPNPSWGRLPYPPGPNLPPPPGPVPPPAYQHFPVTLPDPRMTVVNPPSPGYQRPGSGIFSGGGFGPGPYGYAFAEGGVATGPTAGIFGEAGPEAFVPLKGGKIPVRMSGNDNKPTTVVNINAPLVNFLAEPTRDEVRESAFQAAQMLRRVASG